MRRVRVRADDELAGQGVALEHERVADPVPRPVQPQALRARELLLPEREALGEREEAALFRSSGMTSPRSARWSRKRRTLSRPATRAFAPSSFSNAFAAIGVTYSCEKRQSARTKPASPGATASTPAPPPAASVTAWRARIFSASVIGARGRSEDGGRDRAREAAARVREEAARLDHAPRHGVLAVREEREGNLLAAADAVQDREVRS